MLVAAAASPQQAAATGQPPEQQQQQSLEAVIADVLNANRAQQLQRPVSGGGSSPLSREHRCTLIPG
jgi:hypothetical protein